MTGHRSNKNNPPEQSRAEQSRAEQSRAEQSRAEQSRAEHKYRILRLFTIVLALVVLIGGIGAGYCGYKAYHHIIAQDEKIDALQDDVQALKITSGSSSLDSEEKDFIENCDDAHYNILFLGNSITRHPLTDYWWSDRRGMASSSLDKDYVHLCEKELRNSLVTLKQTATSVNGYAYNYSVWETQSHDRAETYPLIDKYFKNGGRIDCVVVQLGENVSDTSTFTSDYNALLEHLKEEAPKAKIITIGDFWKNDGVDSVKKRVARDEDVSYVDLTFIQDKPEFQAGMETEVAGDDGSEHKIEHSGVAKHPGDKGMDWIADAVMNAVIN